MFDSQDSEFDDLSDATTFATTRETYQVGAQLQQEDNLSYNYSDTLKRYSHVSNFTHKNVLIVTKNKDDMKHILKTMHVNNISSENETDNSTDNNTSDVTSKQTSQKSSSTSKNSSSNDDSYSNSYASEDDLFVVNPKTGYKEYGPTHPNYTTENDYLQEQHSKYDSTY